MTDRELIDKAIDAAKTSYSPYSKFAVGAALEARDGKVFTGCNVENATLGCTICAERTAVVKAVSEGHRRFRRIAVYSRESADYCTPCGICRQVLAEFEPEIEVLCVRSDGRYSSYKLKDLLPNMFTKDSMQ